MAGKKSKNSGDALKDAAREIGSRIGEVHVKASRMVEGVKAAVKASADKLRREPKKKAARKRTSSK